MLRAHYTNSICAWEMPSIRLSNQLPARDCTFQALYDSHEVITEAVPKEIIVLIVLRQRRPIRGPGIKD